MILTIVIKADVSKMALKEFSTDDQIIDTLTYHFTQETANFGTDVWVDDVFDDLNIKDICRCNAQDDNKGICENCKKSIM